MLCGKCGKNNEFNASKCAFCGAAMPEKVKSNGFGDILNYECLNQEQKGAVKNSFQESGKPVGCKRKNITGMIAVVLSILTIAAVGFLVITDRKDERIYDLEMAVTVQNKKIEKLEDESERLQKETVYLKETLDSLLENIYGNTNENNIVE